MRINGAFHEQWDRERHGCMQSTPTSFIALPRSFIASTSPLMPGNSVLKAWQAEGAPWLPSLNWKV